MWRTVIVTQGEKLTIKDGWLVVYSDNNEQRVPISDLYSVVIDNRSALISVNAIVSLAEGAFVKDCIENIAINTNNILAVRFIILLF